MRFDADRLMSLLPAVYRERDADSGELRALLEVIAEQVGVIEDDLEQLYDDQFVETCAEWVLPYIGDLLGNRALFSGGTDADRSIRGLFAELEGPRFIPRVALRARPDVAKTIYYRKRKATRGMLEELAADVTGWAARVVEFFEILRWTQCIRNHTRLFNQGCPDLRNADALKRLDGPFDSIPHSVDVRPINSLEGWYETRNIGFFLWRLRSLALTEINPAFDGGSRFFANRLKLDEPLFTAGGRGETGFLNEAHAPGPIRQSFLRDDLRTSSPSRLYGSGLSLHIKTTTTAIPQNKICASNLSTWRPPDDKDMVVVDVRTGRILFGDNYTPADLKDVRVTLRYGFSSELGGGCYPRASWLIKPALAEHHVITVAKDDLSAEHSIEDALKAWAIAGKPKTVIRIADSLTYTESNPLTIDVPAGSWLAIQADDGKNPHIDLDGHPLTIKCADEKGWVALSGILLEGDIEIAKLAGRLRLLHTTMRLKSGAAKIEVPQAVLDALILNDEIDSFRVEAAFCLLGRIIVPSDGRGLEILDCILDGDGASPIVGTAAGTPASPLHIERSTVFGPIAVRELPMASECIFTGNVRVTRRQQGCARFSFIPDGSLTPRRYRCQPDLEIRTRVDAAEEVKHARLTEAERKVIVDEVVPALVPSFTSIHFGDPGYAQLHLHAPKQITTGAEDGSEMGVFCHLKQPQREANLRARLAEYLPFGLQAGSIYVT